MKHLCKWALALAAAVLSQTLQHSQARQICVRFEVLTVAAED
jgi:hypothetical protein